MADENLFGEKQRLEQELYTQRLIGFANGLFQEEVTVRALMESLAQGIVVIDSNRNVLLLNSRAEQMFGYSNTDVVGKSHDYLIPERFLTTHREYMKHYLEHPKTRPMGIGMDLYGKRKDGSEFPIEISLSYIETKSGILVMALVSDITIRKQIEEVINNRTKELEKLNTDLSEANKNLETFSYSVSHDLKGPLQTLIGFSNILLQEYKGKMLDDEGHDYLKRINYNAIKMRRLIEDILTLSKITRQEVKFQIVDLSEIARTIISDLRRDYPERDVNVLIQNDLKVRADVNLITIALNNLLGNAWKFTGKTASPCIEFGTYRKDGKCIYFIKDNGAGFDMNHSEKLFTPFQRLHPDSEYTGTGVGLAIVERVIKRHGGEVWAKGEVGKGATFFFTLS